MGVVEFVFGLGLLFSSVIGLSYLNQEREKQAWRKLAKANNLSFVSGQFDGKRAYVHGWYRGFRIKLENLFRNNRTSDWETYTQLRLSGYRRRQEIETAAVATPGQCLTPAEVEQMLVPQTATFSTNTAFVVEDDEISYALPGIETDIEKLQHFLDFLVDVADNYSRLRAMGGMVMPGLQQLGQAKKVRFKPLIKMLMLDIAQDTTNRLSKLYHELLCPRCRMSCVEHKVSLSWRQSLSYYGCRNCQQSHHFLRGQVVAVLDSDWPESYRETEGMIAINWLKQRQMFDFNAVDIVAATDEDVERLAVQVGNDMDVYRRANYRQMMCRVYPNARLSENSMRILRKTFGKVIVQAA